jgi:diguanylate cyclase (GGDEF)-like protein/PAS domain S-box-containing protein
MLDGERKRDQLVKKLVEIKRQNVELKAALDDRQNTGSNKFDLLQTLINAIVFSVDAAGNFTYISPAVERITGYQAEEILGASFASFVHPEDIPIVKSSLKRAISGRDEPLEFRALKKDGAVSHYRLSVRLLSENGHRTLTGVITDITDQVLAEQNVRQMASEVQAILQALPDLYFRLDSEGTILDLRAGRAADLYFPVESLLGKNIQDMHPRVGKQFRQAIRQVRETNAPSIIEYSIPRKPAEQFYEARFVPLLDNQIIVIARNITERKKAEEELALRAQLLNAANDAIILHDFEGRFVFVNEAACKLYGYSKKELLQKNINDVTTPESAGSHEARMQELSEKGRSIFEVVGLRKDGSLLPLEINARLTEVGGKVLSLSVARNIAERKRANEELKKERDFTSAVLDTAGAQVVVLNNEGRIVRFNRACELLTGYAFLEVRGRHIWDVLTDDPEATRARTLKELAGENQGTHESCWITRAGERRLISWSTTVLMDGDGAVKHLIATGVDVTERRQTEIDLQEANDKLETRVNDLKERTREMALLSEMGELLQNCESTDEAYAVCAQYIQKLFPDEHGALCLTGASRDMVEAVEMWGDPAPTERMFAPSDCWALRRGRPHLVDDPQPGLMCAHVIGPQAAKYLCVPMMARSEALGILHIRHAGGAEQQGAAWQFSNEHKQRLVVAVADQIAMALANLRLRETLRNMAIRDTLTDLFNRRYMEESLERELRRAERRKTSVGVIMFDIDHFKDFNDLYGHDGGDVLLKELGSFLKSRTRGEDIACRYGGEEFVYVLPEASLNDTLKRAEQLRQEVKQLKVYHMGKRLDNISISLGVTAFPDHGLTAEAILKTADIALYQAKNEGRDRAVVG